MITKVIIKGVEHGPESFFMDAPDLEKEHLGITLGGDKEFVTIGVKTMENEIAVDGRYIILPKSKIQETIDGLKKFL